MVVMSLYAKVKTSTNIIESVGDDNTAEAGYHFKEFISSVAWGAELVGLEVSSEDNGNNNGFPHENLFVTE
jgi:hypothetical protein